MWQDRANCLGVEPALFFPIYKSQEQEAKEICSGCEVRQDCYEFALTSNQGRREAHGIWAGRNAEKPHEWRKSRRSRVA